MYFFSTKNFKGIAMICDKGKETNHKLGNQFTRLVKMVMLLILKVSRKENIYLTVLNCLFDSIYK